MDAVGVVVLWSVIARRCRAPDGEGGESGGHPSSADPAADDVERFTRDHIVRWAWRTRKVRAGRVAEPAAAHPVLPIVRLRSRRDVKVWLAGPGPRAEPRAGRA